MAYGSQVFTEGATKVNKSGTYEETLRSSYRCIIIPSNIT